MKTLEKRQVAEVVTENIHTAHVFKKYGIDFCCGGAVSIAKACEKAGVNYNDLENDLLNLKKNLEPVEQYNTWELDNLADYIVEVHHKYIEESIPLLLRYSAKVTKVHGEKHHEVWEINRLFTKLAKELSAHLKKEELVLFPFIKKMVKAQKEGTPFSAQYGRVKYPINMLESEHEEAGLIMKKISEITNEYIPPANVCNTFRAFYAKLDEFEQDLHRHVHLENNILFPRAINLEKKLQE